MHVLFLSGSGELGGAERSLLDIMASLREATPSWTLQLLAPAEGPLLSEAAAIGAKVDVLPFDAALASMGEPSPRHGRDGEDSGGRVHLAARLARTVGPLAGYVRRLRARIDAAGPDIIHTHGIKAHLLGAWANASPASVIWHLHDYVGRRPTTTTLLRASLGRCAAVVANSVSVAEDAQRALGARVPIVPVLNGVNLDRFSPDGLRATLPRASDGPVTGPPVVRIGLMATFGRWKGHTTFIDACARLPRDLAIEAYVIGGPLYRTDRSQHSLEELQACARHAGVSDRLTFTGFIREADEAIRALDVVVHASTEPEPFGLVIAEAMACGRAVVVANAGGARELVTPGVDAMTHEPGDARSLAECLAVLAADGSLRIRLGADARRTAVRRFDRRRLASELAPLYARVTTRRACA